MKKSVGNFNFLEMAIAYVIIFLILREWLVPIMQLTNTGLLSLFLVFIGLSLALSLFNVNAVLSALVKMGYITWFVVFAYGGDKGTFAFLFEQLTVNMSAIFAGDFGNVTDAFRTVLFLLLIWMLVYLIHHWITVRHNIFYFFALTVFFIATLDTFSEYKGSVAIVKVVVLGLIMTGALFVKRLWVQTDTPHELFAKWKIIFPMILVVVFSSTVAVFLPKVGPTWADPVPFLKSATGQGGGEGSHKKVGYGEDDSQLGGPFVGDDDLVFTARSKDKHYWRVETKDTYTSKGWIQSTDYSELVEYENGEMVMGSLATGSDVKKDREVTIEVSTPMPFVLQTYGLKSISTNDRSVVYIQNIQDEKIKSYKSQKPKSLTTYTMSYNEPVYSLQQLRSSNLSMLETLDFSYERYLQLPISLPQRVKDLTIEVTGKSTSVYEKIKAVEAYFGRTGYKYDKTAAAIPDENQDYVDQFLFDTKIGYCDNFSTSMVVMLRSIGIPARWVKGFSPGEGGPKSDGYREYEITNNNAHSWVEAYVPGSGWMEFEPTIGFTNDVNIDYDIEISEEEPVLEQPKPQEKKDLAPKEEKKKEKGTEGSNIFVDAWKWLANHPIIIWGGGILIAVIALALFVNRRKWIPKIYIRSYRKKEANWSTFDTSYQILMKQLSRAGLPLKDGETLSAFAQRVDAALETGEMKKLTTVYEQHIYSKNPKDVDFNELKESWEYLINRTID